jgi:serine phosphatase RsbU (regulator of sigma subunit)
VIEALEGGRDVPLGVLDDTRYGEALAILRPGDGLLLYTDGITEARSPQGEEFGTQRLDRRLANAAKSDPGWTIQGVLDSVAEFTQQGPAEDDRTLVAAEVVD